MWGLLRLPRFASSALTRIFSEALAPQDRAYHSSCGYTTEVPSPASLGVSVGLEPIVLIWGFGECTRPQRTIMQMRGLSSVDGALELFPET